MQAVGRIGSYISRSVYTVSGPFHPFGGAVDVIVVEQPDGSYKSSPWYVRFGKFQGVLKTKEKVVNVSVNGVQADFHMYLNHKGEAFFLKEVDEEEEGESVCSPPSSSGEDSDRKPRNRIQMKSKSWNCESNWSASIASERKDVTRTNPRRSQIFGLFGRRSKREEGIQEEENASDVNRSESMERAEIAANLLDLKWSTNLAPSRRRKDNASQFSDETGLISHTSYQEVERTFDENGVERKCVTSEYVVKTATSVESVREDTNLAESDFHVSSLSIVSEFPKSDSHIQDYSGEVCVHASRISEEEQLLFGNLDEFGSTDHEQRKADGVNESSDAKFCPVFSIDESVINDCINDDDVQKRRSISISSDVCINETGPVLTRRMNRTARSLPIISPLSSNFEANSLDPSPGAQTTADDVKILKESKEGPINPMGAPPRPNDALKGSQRNWPFSFNRSTSVQISDVESNSSYTPNAVEILSNSSDLEGLEDVTKVKAKRKIIKTLTPTSEQLASLNLKEGKNIIAFTFSTAMLGNQQVDAQIFLWRWDTRIVISDVDGTITRSDLLGQVMPLVGMDWSQTGVAHLFSAIKENGYQLLFLSARSISQSFHTRQFLCNIKQDGKALPDGPVVISPDGLFPSLFREVVRRAPHEFKIACLEDIKALFPADANPFYAGFGNRDTDEFSYLKVGIPRGKIFIINPKGEIAVNRRVDTKSYLSLHALVHGMFPCISSFEQEDFNSWNYWKLPPPLIDL